MSDDGFHTIGDNEEEVNKACPFAADNEICGVVFKVTDAMAAKEERASGIELDATRRDDEAGSNIQEMVLASKKRRYGEI